MVDEHEKKRYNTICACVAQLAEQLTRNEQVAGSNPATSSKKAFPVLRDRKGFSFFSFFRAHHLIYIDFISSNMVQ